MSKTIAIPDATYDRLVLVAQQQGLSGVEELLENWAQVEERSPRKEAIDRIRTLHAQMAAKYGRQSDSTELIREDRDR